MPGPVPTLSGCTLFIGVALRNIEQGHCIIGTPEVLTRVLRKPSKANAFLKSGFTNLIIIQFE